MALANAPIAADPIAASLSTSSDQANVAFLDISETVLSQYANSPVMRRLIDAFSQWLDPANRFDAFYRQMWDINTAEGYGLDVWGRILGVVRVVKLQRAAYLGFASSTSAQSFGHGIWYSGTPLTDNVALTDEAYRTLLLAKAALNITNASIPGINQILLDLFGQGYVRDNLDMTMTYVFTTTLTPVQSAIVFQSGVLPKPCGVSFTVEQP